MAPSGPAYLPCSVIAAWRCLTSVSGLTCEKTGSVYPAPSATANPASISLFFIRFLLSCRDVLVGTCGRHCSGVCRMGGITVSGRGLFQRRGSGPRSNDRFLLLFLERLHQVLAPDAQPAHDRRHDQHRGIDPETDADGEGERKVVQGRSSEQIGRASCRER